MNRYTATIKLVNGRKVQRYIEAMSTGEAWMQVNGIVARNPRMEEVLEIERKGRIRHNDAEVKYYGYRRN